MRSSGKQELSPRIKKAVARLKQKKSLENFMALGREAARERTAYEQSEKYERDQASDRRQLIGNVYFLIHGLAIILSIAIAVGGLLDLHQWLRWGKDQTQDCVKLENIRWGERGSKNRHPLLLSYTTKTNVKVVNKSTWDGERAIVEDQQSILDDYNKKACVTLWYEPGHEKGFVTLQRMRAPFTVMGGLGQISLLVAAVLWLLVWRSQRDSA